MSRKATTVPGPRGLHSQSLDLMRFPLAIVVLTVHISVINLTGPSQAHAARAFWKVVEVFFHDQSVPIYFFIAGYVFFLNNGMTVPEYKRKLFNRTRSLLIPYIIWNALMILRVWLKSVFLGGAGFDPTFANILSCFWIYDGALEHKAIAHPTYPLNLPLWFLRDLMIIVVSTPLIYWLLRRARHYLVLLLAALWLVRNSQPDYHAVQLMTALFFFSWGGYMSICDKDMIKEFGRVRNVTMLAYPILGLACWWAQGSASCIYPHVKDLYVITGLCVYYNVAAWLLQKGYCKVRPLLSNSSFFVYISHYLVCYYIAKGIFSIASPSSSVSVIACYLISVAATAGLLVGVFWLMREYAPAMMRVVAGRK